MSFLQKIKADWVGDGREIAGAFTESANTKASFDEDIPGDATDKEYAFAFDVTKLKLLFMLSTEDLAVNTNSSGAPDDMILLKKNLPLVWSSFGGNSYYGSPVNTADVTKLFITNSSGIVARLQIEALFDSEV